MSGGRFNYISSSIGIAMDIPSGTYGIGKGKYNNYASDVKDVRALNPMHDTELSEMLYDMTCLLHSLEWYESGDIGEDGYLEDAKIFKAKWFGRTSEQTIEAYREDIKEFTKRICSDLKTEDKADEQIH